MSDQVVNIIRVIEALQAHMIVLHIAEGFARIADKVNRSSDEIASVHERYHAWIAILEALRVEIPRSRRRERYMIVAIDDLDTGKSYFTGISSPTCLFLDGAPVPGGWHIPDAPKRYHARATLRRKVHGEFVTFEVKGGDDV